MNIEIGISGIKYRNLTADCVYPASPFCGSSAVHPLSSNKGICHLNNKNLKNTELIFFRYESLRFLILLISRPCQTSILISKQLRTRLYDETQRLLCYTYINSEFVEKSGGILKIYEQEQMMAAINIVILQYGNKFRL